MNRAGQIEETREYAFDVKLIAAIRVKASSVEEARKLLRGTVDAASANLGAWPNGDPIVCEVSVDDAHTPCFEVDGDAGHPDCEKQTMNEFHRAMDRNGNVLVPFCTRAAIENYFEQMMPEIICIDESQSVDGEFITYTVEE